MSFNQSQRRGCVARNTCAFGYGLNSADNAE